MWPTNTKIDATLARYLLSDLSPKQAGAIDEKSLADESYIERLNLTESALICDFICGGLSDDDRERLERRFLRSKEKARKIELAQFLYYQAHHPDRLQHELNRAAHGQSRQSAQGPPAPVWKTWAPHGAAIFSQGWKESLMFS